MMMKFFINVVIVLIFHQESTTAEEYVKGNVVKQTSLEDDMMFPLSSKGRRNLNSEESCSIVIDENGNYNDVEDVIDNGVVTCGGNVCQFANIDGCDELICSSFRSCRNADVSSTNTVRCTAGQSCRGATFEEVTYVKCQATSACHGATFNTNVNLINCDYENACTGSIVLDEVGHIFNGIIFCGADDSCKSALTTQVQNTNGCVICNTNDSCKGDSNTRGFYGNNGCSDPPLQTITDLCNIDATIDIDFLDGDLKFSAAGDEEKDCEQLRAAGLLDPLV